MYVVQQLLLLYLAGRYECTCAWYSSLTVHTVYGTGTEKVYLETRLA